MTEENRDMIEAVVPESPEEPSISKDDVETSTGMLSRAEVSKIVERERLKAFEKGRKKAMQEFEQNTQAGLEPAQEVQRIQPQSQGLGGMAPSLSKEDIESLIMQKAPEALMSQVQMLKGQQMIQSFADKMQAAESRYPGLEEKLNQLNYNDPAMIKLVEMSNNLENTGDVINELVSNPNKMIQVLAGIREQPFLGQQALMSLSNSIRQNQEAEKENAQAKEPIPKTTASVNSGMANAENMSVKDLQRMLSQRK